MPDKPRFLFIQISSECNLACKHCHYWESDTKNQPERLSIATIESIITEFAGLSPQGQVVICGGETMLEYDRYLAVCKISRDNRLRVLAVSNGSKIANLERATDLILNGPHELSISLDGHTAAIHEDLRGTPNSFPVATRAVKLMLDARKQLGNTDSKINVMVLLTSATYTHLRELYQLVLRDLGADKMKVNSLQPSFVNATIPHPVDNFFASYSQLDVPVLMTELRFCNEEFKLNLDPRWIAGVEEYYTDLQGVPGLKRGWMQNIRTRTHICNSHDRNLMVGLYGEIGLCFGFSNFTTGKYLQLGDLTTYWENGEPLREEMRSCNRLCGVSHSNRAIEATLKHA